LNIRKIQIRKNKTVNIKVEETVKMILPGKTICNPLKDKKGFTLIEVMIVSAMISVLSSIAIFNYIPFRKKALDTTARADARNLVQSVITATLSDEDVDYTKTNTGGEVGELDTSGNSRNPVFILSPGVAAVITGDSNQAPDGNTTVFDAIVYHTNGTLDPSTSSGRKEYVCSVDESSGTSILP